VTQYFEANCLHMFSISLPFLVQTIQNSAIKKSTFEKDVNVFINIDVIYNIV